MDWDNWIFVLIVIVLIACVLCALPDVLLWVVSLVRDMAGRGYVGGDEMRALRVGSAVKGTILLIPGLGDGVESFNWNLSTAEQRVKAKIEGHTTSLQDTLAGLGYHVICADPPGFGSNFDIGASTIDDYLEVLRGLSPDVTLVIGHSIGARIAQLYGNTYECAYIMLDPTPDYVIESVNYRKHLDDPTNVSYRKTHEFLQMITAGLDRIRGAAWTPSSVIVSIDDVDPSRVKKEAYFDALPVNLVKIPNATHWVHVTHPEAVVSAVHNVSD